MKKEQKGRFTPVVRNFVVSDLRSGKSKYALDVQGFKDAPIYNLRLADCSFSNVAEPDIIKNVKGLTFQNVRINGKLVESDSSERHSAVGRAVHPLKFAAIQP